MEGTWTAKVEVVVWRQDGVGAHAKGVMQRLVMKTEKIEIMSHLKLDS